MKTLRDGIHNKDDIKRSSAYVNADPTKISAYDQALQNAENIINATPQAELNRSTIEQALTRVQQAQNALDVYNNWLMPNKQRLKTSMV